MPNAKYFTSVSLKISTFIYNSNSKIIHNFCMCGGNIPPVGVEITSPREKFFTIGNFRKNTSKYEKLMVEPDICDNLNQIHRFFHF